MDSMLENKLTVGAAGLAAIVLGVVAVLHFQHTEAPHATPAPAAASWDGPIGPGQLAAPGGAFALGIDPQAARDPHLALDGAGHLVPDLALRTLVDSYVGQAGPGERKGKAAQLHAFLASKLKAPALADADRIVGDYIGYLGTEEQLLAQAHFTRPGPEGLSPGEVEHLLAWQEQRAKLRERMLGSAVARAWFEAEDASCAGALRDWQKMREPADSPDLDSNELQARRLHGAVLEERRNEDARDCATRIMDGLAKGR